MCKPGAEKPREEGLGVEEPCWGCRGAGRSRHRQGLMQ